MDAAAAARVKPSSAHDDAWRANVTPLGSLLEAEASVGEKVKARLTDPEQSDSDEPRWGSAPAHDASTSAGLVERSQCPAQR